MAILGERRISDLCVLGWQFGCHRDAQEGTSSMPNSRQQQHQLPSLGLPEMEAPEGLFPLPLSPQMSYATAGAGSAMDHAVLAGCKGRSNSHGSSTRGSVYDEMHAQFAESSLQSPRDRYQQVFDMAASPMLSPGLLLRRGHDVYMQSPNLALMAAPPPSGAVNGRGGEGARHQAMSPGSAMASLEGFIQAAAATAASSNTMSAMSARSSSTLSSSPSLLMSPSARVTKVPVRPANRHRSARRHDVPLLLPCQVIDPKTNKLGLQPGCPDLLVSRPHDDKKGEVDSMLCSPGSSAMSPAARPRLPPSSQGMCLPFVQPDSRYITADFAAHRSAFLNEYSVLDFTNITVLEMKMLLRKYGLARTGKKIELEDRIRQVAEFLEHQIAREREAVQEAPAENKDGASGMDCKIDPSIYINA